ncbi:MAG: hypothetical protein EBR67_06255 [Proteobacteria bacterium]|nr:hypothetical protein [Pseudomonadota bacterium]
MINTRAQQQTVEYLKLYQDLLSRFAVDDRKIGSTEQAAISFIDLTFRTLRAEIHKNVSNAVAEY